MKKEVKKFLKYLGISFLSVYSAINFIVFIGNNLILRFMDYDILDRIAKDITQTINTNEFKEVYRSLMSQDISANASLSNEILFCSIVFSIIIAMIIYLIKDKTITVIKLVIFIIIMVLLVLFFIYSINQINSELLNYIVDIPELIKLNF